MVSDIAAAASFRPRGEANTGGVGQKCGVDFEARPELVVSAGHALKPAPIEWNEGNLNAVADRDDIAAITHKIKGGLNGLDSRREWLAKLRPLINSVEFDEIVRLAGLSSGRGASCVVIGG